MSYNNNAPPGPPQNQGAPVPDSYFTESRKGEVNELRNLLRNFSTQKDMKKKREIIKKVIAYMTLGIDVSRLFTEMMLVIETRDLVIKKMVYLFLCNYATANPELAQMCTNTLTKDCNNDDPMVRGLALRSLCSLRLPQMVEYVSEPLNRALNDSHAYVRKTAVMGILKLYHLDEEILERNGFVDTLYDMLKDPDAAVVTNCILVLNELMQKSGGMAINRAIMLHLLNRLGEFSEFGVVAVLDLVPRYIPANQEEGYQIMNLLDPVLGTTNAGAFMAVIFAFLSLAENLAGKEMKQQIVTRVKAPVITMMTGGSAELMYVMLKHVDALIELCPGVFDDEYRQFYLRHHEPTNVKYLKIQVLAKLANPTNAPDIVGELSECVSDSDATLSRLSVQALARIACRDVGGEGCAENITCRLIEMVDLDIAHISSEAATALAAILRKNPSLRELIAPPLPRALKYIHEGRGKASVIHLLGELGDIIPEAPYALEKLIDGYDHIKCSEVKSALLTSTIKLFLKRPPEVQRMLGRLLQSATEDVSCQDLHDRALLYYRLLRNAPDPSIVDQVVKTNMQIAGSANFAEENFDEDMRDELMKEFNTLSIVFGTTSDNFVSEENQIKFVKMPAEHPLDGGAGSVESAPVNPVDSLASQVQEASLLDHGPVDTTPAPATAPMAAEMDLLGFGTEPTPAPVVPPVAASTFSLIPNVALSGDEYQSKWGAVSDADAHVIIVPLTTLPPSTDAVETPLSQASIKTMASGELPTEFKFFLYAQDASSDGSIIMVQASIGKSSPCEMLLTIKISGPGGFEKADAFVNVLKNALGAYAS
ncbi:beta subunit of clathrin adaptor complex AP2 [Chaetoceros tenuissimus]|uniref:Beta subunit of clathrin adaptor complex AP2 n=1 Tax=Chaetoceros tenuissimus TaxID=426638 RepID=A0AAD3D235_9STRA|nr:beta subunit of clathrin adaptor complex AP2 [Chaetoceros tenuissimus]